jgi:hypothetical protein
VELLARLQFFKKKRVFFIILVRVQYSVHELLCAYSDHPIISPIFVRKQRYSARTNIALFMVEVAKIRSLSLSGDTLFERPPTGEPPYNLRRRFLLQVLLVLYIFDKVFSLPSFPNPIKRTKLS